jgi:hypothetical protein
MVKLSEIEKLFLYSYQNKEIEIKHKLDIEIKEINDGLFKIMRNNFSRFWNLLTKEQKIKYTILSTGKEELYFPIEKIIRYSCIVSNNEFAKNIIRYKFHGYDYNSNYIYYENDDDEFNLRHNLVKYWISLTKDEKTNFIEIVNKYWEKNNYTEYIPWKITDIKENDILDVRDNGLKSIDLIITDNIKYLNCSQNKIDKLDDLPVGLEVLICEDNPIKSLNNLPRGLKYLCCDGCDLTELLNLPQDLRYLDISNNFLETIELPQYIETLYINMIHQGYNVKTLEYIPNMIKDLELVNEKMVIKTNFPYGLEKFKRNEYIQDSSIITDYIGLPRSIKELEEFKVR